ncbi:chromobox protein homolog 1-like [Coccinella septempunctata]|uniref:chromobox protein homolog 1-like n=1 Tax=Coccinella septempunctata TaxID=41139 RepID=UPI001D075FFC|nr:chromobox protein homolog 1-like [Coccinella septempunctata]
MSEDHGSASSASSNISVATTSAIDDDSDAASIKYTAEKLMDLKMDQEGNKMFLVKWNDYPEEDNTWETESNLSCNSLMKALVKEKRAKRTYRGTPGKLYKKYQIAKKYGLLKSSQTSPPPQKKQFKYVKFEDRITGFDMGFTPELIMGATVIEGELEFLVRWREDDRTDLIPRIVANEKCPQLVINYYERNIVWPQETCQRIDK